MSRRGIILAGGVGSRLYPLTRVTSKQLLPIFDKPMIYYPLTTLMLAGIRDIAIISTRIDLPRFEQLLGHGSQWGISIRYLEQPEPRGIADAITVGADHLGGHKSALILGDNFFYGHGLKQILDRANRNTGATVFGYQVRDPERYGVVVVDEREMPTELLEKPNPSPSNWAITGLYFYDERVVEMARDLQPSRRGELEITDLNRRYLETGSLNVELLYRGFAWLDTGTHESLQEASTFVETVQKRQGLLIASPEEVAFRMGFISNSELHSLARMIPESGYGQYLRRIANAPKSATPDA